MIEESPGPAGRRAGGPGGPGHGSDHSPGRAGRAGRLPGPRYIRFDGPAALQGPDHV